MMTLQLRPFVLRTLLTAGLFCGASSFGQYIQTNTSVTYPANNVEYSATAAPNDVVTFSNAVKTACAADLGSDLSFSGTVVNGTTNFTLVYGPSKSRQVTITSSSPVQYVGSTSGSFTPVSGSTAVTTTSDVSSYDLAIGPITDLASNLVAEAVVKVGFVILSRSNSAYPLDVCATVSFNNGSTLAVTNTIGYGKGSNDTFFGFTSPAGLAITNVNLASFVKGTSTPVSNRIGFDDFAFVSASQLSIGSITPPNYAIVSYTNAITFEAVSGLGNNIDPSGISLVLNSTNDVSSQLVVTGTTNSDRWASFANLLPGQTYNGLITVSNAQGSVSRSFTFYTWTNPVPQFDAGGFSDTNVYPLGTMASVTNGGSIWTPPSSAAQLTNLMDAAYGTVLRELQTGGTNDTWLQIPLIASGVLRMAFDTRVSNPSVRTMDISLFTQKNGGLQAGVLCFGVTTNAVSGQGQLAYYKTNWVGLLDWDTNWHHIEMVHYLSGTNSNTYDLSVDGTLVGTNLAFRNSFPPNTVFPFLRIRNQGPAGEYADLDNLVITAGPEAVAAVAIVPQAVSLINPARSGSDFSFQFLSQNGVSHVVQYSASLAPVNWTDLVTIPGDGSVKSVTNSLPGATGFYRVVTH